MEEWASSADRLHLSCALHRNREQSPEKSVHKQIYKLTLCKEAIILTRSCRWFDFSKCLLYTSAPFSLLKIYFLINRKSFWLVWQHIWLSFSLSIIIMRMWRHIIYVYLNKSQANINIWFINFSIRLGHLLWWHIYAIHNFFLST